METTDPAAHGLPGHNWTVKKLKQWASQAFGRLAGRNTLRRVLRPTSRRNVRETHCLSFLTVQLWPGKPCAAGSLVSTASTICFTCC